MADSRTGTGPAPARLVAPRHALARLGVPTFVVVCVALGAPPARAQSSRAEEIARLQAEKAQQLRPYEPHRAERVLDVVDRLLMVPGTGPYPWIGSIYPGGFLGLGAGYRYIFGDTGAFNGFGAWSLKNYKVGRVDLKLPEFADRRVIVATHAMWLDAPKVAFYGIGPDTSRTQRTTYEYSPTSFGATGTIRVTDWLRVGGGAESLIAESASGTTTPGAAPGLGEDVTYTVGRASAEIDWRTSPGYSRRGGLYRAEWKTHHDRDGGGFAFRQAEMEVIQLLPLFQESSIIALRGLVTTTDTDAGEAVPIFLLPSLGGGRTLRGYPSWRFRDRHRVLVSAEYRWTPAQVMDMALFVDGGKVASRRGDLDLSGLRTNVGIGMRIHGPSFTALRIDLARGREGWVLNLGGGTAF